MKKSILVLSLGILLLYSCGSLTESTDPNSAYFVTMLGNDTLAVESFTKTENGINAQVLLRSPRTVFYEYSLNLNGSGGIQEMTRTTQAPLDAFTEEGKSVTQSVALVGDSLISEFETNNGSRRFAALNQPATLPFIDMVHWPYELAFNAAAKNPKDSIHQMLLTGRRVSDFIIHKAGNDSLTLRHPSRGVMGVDIDANGNLVKLDAALTTRKLIVRRTSTMDFESIVKDFAERDKNGSPFAGNLSGAVEETFTFKGADFRVQYGSPKKRGRKIYGGIVSYGQRWRTGANRATHFKTSKDLQVGELTVPAGEYTIFTIPEENGGTMIINKQTGQNGQRYDESRDLGRIPMNRTSQTEVTEDFTVKVVETGNGGSLQLIWDQTVLSIDFTIK